MGSFELDKFPVYDLYDRYKKGRLRVDPEYQRSKAWSDNLKSELIDTVSHEWPMGLVMLNVDQRLDSSGQPIVYYDVVDGQQRLRSIFEYMDAVEDWTKGSSKKSIKTRSYASLTESEQERFKYYRVSVALMRDYETDEILDVFSRLQNGRPLRIGEKIKALRTSHKPYIRQLTDHGLFSLGNSVHKTRDAHWNLATVFYKGIYRGNPLDRHEYERLVGFLQDSHSFDEKCARQSVAETKRLMNLVRKTIEEASDLDVEFSEKVSSARLLKWAFASIYMLDKDYSLTGREHLLAKGLAGYWSAKENEESQEWFSYVTTGRTGRMDTSDVATCLDQLQNWMIQAASLQPKDAQRHFTPGQRKEIYKRSCGACASCGISLSETNFHADHIQPYSQSGPTTLENGQALCSACNLKKGGAIHQS